MYITDKKYMLVLKNTHTIVLKQMKIDAFWYNQTCYQS